MFSLSSTASNLAAIDGALAGAPLGNHVPENQQSRKHPPRESSEGISMVHSRGSVSGKSPSAHGRSSPAYRLTQAQWRMQSSGAFKAFAADHPFPAKLIAQVVECSPKTAKSWVDGDTTPAGVLDIRCMEAIPQYAALKRKLARMETDLDPLFQAELSSFIRAAQRLGGAE